jgi:hypothetical protein
MNKKAGTILFFFCTASVTLFILLIYAFHTHTRKTAISKTPDYVQDESAQISYSGKDATKSHDLSLKKHAAVNKGRRNSVTSTKATTVKNRPIILAFAGDVNLDENCQPAAQYDKHHGHITACFSKSLLSQMKSADVMMLNNEFSYSLRGTKASNKSFTFRAKPSRAEILKKMNVDLVSLANNHTLDYGQDALLDTFDALENTGIDYVGAGRNLKRAKAAIYKTVNGKKIAYLAASRVVFSTDWYASANRPGMLGTYDSSMLVQSIKEARKKSDYVIVFVHWGVERKASPEEYQRNLAKEYINAGADAVIGSHPHVLQGFEYYHGKPIAYSLGNYWFNGSHARTGLLKLYLDTNQTIRMQILPAMQQNTRTNLIQGKKGRSSYFDYMKGISFGVAIDKNGFITDAHE